MWIIEMIEKPFVLNALNQWTELWKTYITEIISVTMIYELNYNMY